MKKIIRIRPPVVSDSSVIQGLLEQLGYKLTAQETSEKIASFAQKQGHHAFVAEIDGEVRGFMSLHIMEWFHRPGCLARLDPHAVNAAGFIWRGESWLPFYAMSKNRHPKNPTAQPSQLGGYR